MPALPEVIIVHDVVPGRTRFRIQAMKASPTLAQRIQEQICQMPGIHTAEVSVITGSVLVLYHPDKMSSAVLQGTIDRAGVRYEARSEVGHPVERIVSAARDDKSDLIVLGSRGLSAWKSLLLGSVSAGVLHHAPCSVLISRGETISFSNILLASDASACAQKAAQAAVAVARRFDASLTVLNVFEPTGLLAVEGGSNPNPIKAIEEQMAAERQSMSVEQSLQQISKAVGVTYSLSQEVGHPAEIIVSFANKSRSDLIIMGSRGLGTFKSLLLGSVSTAVVHHATCPIIIVR